MKKLYSLIVNTDNKSIRISKNPILAIDNPILLKTNCILDKFAALNINLDAATHSDSFGIDLLISCIHTASDLHKKLISKNIPHHMCPLPVLTIQTDCYLCT